MSSSSTLATPVENSGVQAGSTLSARLITFGTIVALFGLYAGTIHFWDSRSLEISPAFSNTFIFACFPLLLGIILHIRKNASFALSRLSFCPNTACFGLIFIFVSDWLPRGYNLFQGPSIRGELLAVFLILLLFFRYFSKATFAIGAVCSCLLLYGIFITLSSGMPIISDDHSSFIFRLSLLRDYFPSIPIYHPWWNLGLDARDFFATGAISFFILTAPFQYLFSITDSYNYALGFVIFIVSPLSLAYATSLVRIANPGPAIAAILSLATSLIWYRWSLKYGTMGFVTSATLMPIVFALGARLINNELLNRRQFVLFVFCTSLACMWPLGATCYLALAIIAIFRFKSVLKNKQIIIAAVLLLLINLPWAALFWKVSQVGSFLQSPRTEVVSEAQQDAPEFRHKGGDINLSKSLKVLREQANGTNPLILFLFLPGLSLLSREFRKPFILQSLILLFGGTILVTLKPQLELDRLLVFLTILLVIPTTQALVSLLNRATSSAIMPCIAFSFLLLSPWVNSNILHNRSAEVYHFADTLPQNLVNAIKENVSTGRALFSGFVLHEMSSGHVAPLAIWSKKPIIASSPFHNKWKYTDVLPQTFAQRGKDGVLEFLDLVNAEVVIAHEQQWRNFFLDLPEQFELVWKQKPFLMFKKKNFSSNYFISGEGEILEQNAHSVHIKLNSSDAILKFSYFPFLVADSCTLNAHDAGLELPLIKLSNCPVGKRLIIQSVGPLERFLQ